MQSIPPERTARIRLPGLGVSIVLLVMLVLAAALSWKLAEKFAPAIFPPLWKSDLKRGEDLTEKDPQKAAEYMLKAKKEAQSAHVSGISLANIDCKLGLLYIAQDNREEGEKLVESAINAAADAKEHYKMAVFCQDASWAEHSQFWKDSNWLPKLEYQQKAVATTGKLWGEKYSEYYLWTLAQLYIDLNNLPKAEECLNKAVSLRKKANDELKGFHYGTLARLYAFQHKWDKSLDAFLKGHQADLDDKDGSNLLDSAYKKDLNDANPERTKYDYSAVRLLVEKNNFSKLEDMANKLMANKEILADGYWRIDKFFDALLLYESGSEEHWQAYLKNLSAWVQEKPQSVAARVALANAYVRYAWKARGSGWAETVSDKGWKKMAERLKLAEVPAREAQKLPVQCPHVYPVLANIALGQQLSRADYDKLVAQCRQQFPDYLPIYMSKVYYLQPRWNGTNGEAEDFIKAVADKIGGEDGDIAYVQLIWSLDNMRIFDNIFSESKGLDWQRAKRGLLALIKRCPHDTTVRGELVSLALQADDQKALKDVFATAP